MQGKPDAGAANAAGSAAGASSTGGEAPDASEGDDPIGTSETADTLDTGDVTSPPSPHEPQSDAGSDPSADLCESVLGFPNPPLGIDGALAQAVDMDGDGQLDLPIANETGVSFLTRRANGSFEPSSFVELRLDAGFELAVGDLDGDDDPDLVVANFYANTVAVVLNTEGELLVLDQYDVGTLPGAIAIADFNGDELQDIAVSSYQDGKLSVLLNQGSEFAPAQQYLGAAGSFDVIAIELNDDSSTDLLVAIANTGLVPWLNQGDGTFKAGAALPAGTGPVNLGAMDLNADGRPDVVALNDRLGFSVLLNQGDGTLSEPMSQEHVGSGRGLTLGDLDGDDDIEVAFSGPDGSLAIAQHLGDGAFAPAIDYALGGNLQQVVLGDLDQDGLTDVAASTDAGLSVLYNDAQHGIGWSYSLPYAPAAVEVVDLSGDGVRDLAVARSTGLSVLKNLGDGSFEPSVDYVTGNASSCIASGDLDGDGDIDLAVGNTYSSDVSVFLNTGNGAMLAEPNLALSPQPLSREPIALQLHDLDGDRALDMVVATRDMLMVGLNPGDGHFDAASFYNVSQLSGPFAVADWDLDHDLDLAIAVPGGITVGIMDVVVLENAGDGTFTSLGGYEASLTVASSIVTADFDGDGWPDIAIGNSLSREFRVLLNRDDSVFETWPWDTYEVVDDFRSMVAADANGDGLSDLVLFGDTRIRVALNSGAGHFAFPQQDYAAGKLIHGIGIGDVAGDTRPDIAVADVYGSSVRVLTNTCR